jgi:hypothetical protein
MADLSKWNDSIYRNVIDGLVSFEPVKLVLQHIK